MKIGKPLSYVLSKIPPAVFIIVFAVIVGVFAGLGDFAVRWLIEKFSWVFFEQGGQLLSFLGRYYIILIPIIGGLLVGPMVYFLAPEAKGHGVPEVMEAVAVKGGRIRPVVAFVKAVASALCIGTGGSVGREGPIVQIGSSIGSSVGQFFKLNENRTKALVACGAAGGIAATFNAPIAGMFFAMEIIMGWTFQGMSFSAVVISAVTANIISRIFFGNAPVYKVPEYSLVSPIEIINYIILGILAAFVAVLFTKSLYFAEEVFGKWKLPGYIKPAIGGIMLGIIGIISFKNINLIRVWGTGYNTIDSVLNGENVWYVLLVLLIFKIIATSLVLGSGNSGGVFAPSLFMGAMLGGSFGGFAHRIMPGISAGSGAYALVGMAAVFAGAAQAPITAIMIIFEMTGNYRVILPLMTSCVVSVLLYKTVQKYSIYEIKLLHKGIRIQYGRERDIMGSIRVEDAMHSQVECISKYLTLKEVADILNKSMHNAFVVVDDNGLLDGLITMSDVRKYLDKGEEYKDLKVEDIATKNVVCAYPDENLDQALRKFGLKDVGRLPVVDRNNNRKILGIITRTDIVRAYNKALLSAVKAKGFEEKGIG